MTYPWTTEEKQALTPGTPLVLVGTERKPDDELVLFEKLWQDGERALVRFSDSNAAPFSYAWDRLRPMSMQWASPGARPDEFALQQARIRRLEKELGLEKEKTARERKANGELALLVHELRKDKEALEEEHRVAAGFVVPTQMEITSTALASLDDREARWQLLKTLPERWLAWTGGGWSLRQAMVSELRGALGEPGAGTPVYVDAAPIHLQGQPIVTEERAAADAGRRVAITITGDEIRAALAQSDDDGEPAAGDYVAKAPAAVEYPEPGDRVRVRSYGRAGVPWTGTVADVWACDGLMAVEADPECGLNLARHVVQLSDVVERLPRSAPITPTQQPEDALARDAGAE